jgi:hypothetical protein
MALGDAVKKVCLRLGPKGWGGLLKHHGLDITKADLEKELSRELKGIDRTVPGFEDFALEGRRGIEPGIPARSLLYHALASANVVDDAAGHRLKDFPTLAEIEAVENYVFGATPPSVQELRALAANRLLAVAVFALEYRPAHETVHRSHADLCFSRTGVARVGNKSAHYDPARRGFLPLVKGDRPHDIRVLPARYAPFVAVQRHGDVDSFGPMNAQGLDARHDFWVPLHKLFPGRECLRSLELTCTLSAHHVNEKLRRIHVAANLEGGDKAWGWGEPDISKAPFVIRETLAELSSDPDHGLGLLLPVAHPLVEEARYKGRVLTFTVPRSAELLSSSLYISADGERRKGPEFVHARHAVTAGGANINLNDEAAVAQAVHKGNYQAKHYVDHTADGWIEALCPEIAADIPRRVPAYSLVTPPDFFFSTDQRELAEWTEQSVRGALRRSLWVVPPDTLNDVRLAPNITLTKRFVPEDKTVTAIVSLPRRGTVEPTRAHLADSQRHAHLPDAAAGVFDPGWDVSTDSTDGTGHFAMYGLGSPFPEDAKLCAALSTFWPAVAPDTARVFQPNVLDTSPTVAPLTDSEIGIGGIAWDGSTPPKVRTIDGVEMVEYADFDHVDYVEAALGKKFSLTPTLDVDTREYEGRVLAMARVYRALGITTGNRDTQIRQKAKWSVLSFQKLDRPTRELRGAEKATARVCTLPAYRFELYRHGRPVNKGKDVRKIHVPIHERAFLFVDTLQVLFKRGTRDWKAVSDA